MVLILKFEVVSDIETEASIDQKLSLVYFFFEGLDLFFLFFFFLLFVFLLRISATIVRRVDEI